MSYEITPADIGKLSFTWHVWTSPADAKAKAAKAMLILRNIECLTIHWYEDRDVVVTFTQRQVDTLNLEQAIDMAKAWQDIILIMERWQTEKPL